MTFPSLSSLEPAAVWRHFATLCSIPRPSGHEAAVRERIHGWALSRGLETHQDATGNLLIRKPASAGMADRPGVILQGHLDMVCQANRGIAHDFLHDPISARLEDGWLLAPDTTLGADNGIGVAMALAVLESSTLRHGPLEVLLTVDEETGMTGARGLAPGWLQGELLLNLDTEDWGEFYIGCAGGLDVDVQLQLETHALPPGLQGYALELGGLRGGHSGVDIHLGRGNAIRLMLRVLRELASLDTLELLALEGGSARNALPREARALLALPPGEADALQARVAQIATTLKAELGAIDPGLTLDLVPVADTPDAALTLHTLRRLLAVLLAAPCGVRRMSPALPGVVETSNNFGTLAVSGGRCRANFMVRSLVDGAAADLAEDIRGLFSLVDAEVEFAGEYPGWKPVPDAPLLALARQVYAAHFGAEPAVKVIHAGLECGLIGGTYPQLQMISFGPDVHGAHAPGERVGIASVGHAFELLTALLAAIPARTIPART